MIADRTLVRIRERSMLDLLDLALVVVRRRPVTLGLAALAGIAPWAYLNDRILALDTEWAVWLWLLALFVEAPWATAPVTIVLGGLMFGRRPPVVQVVRDLVRALPTMLLYQGLVRSVLVVSHILIPLVPARLAFTNEVILLERGRWWRVLRRCDELCGDRGGALVLQWLLHLFFGLMFVICFWIGAGAMTNTLIRELTWDEPDWSALRGWKLQLGMWLAIAFFGVARFFSYIDTRIRREGWEVELRLKAVGQAMAMETQAEAETEV